MLDFMKKVAFTSVGLAFLTKEKVEELAREIIEKGKLSEQEGREILEELRKKSEQARSDVENKVSDMVQKTLTKMNLATRDDLAKLETRLDEIVAASGKDKEPAG
ncbi:MAG: hypothetical protein A2521_08395 [Deltaproteobacteria bacterium RIFOXYD12_FULL_57_12]|nr:MAG: hypothetical protein A2521_08395 [Deltaproteobacteria bacterium RIFOXYD12_FULL_57_12]